jgi:hypothetical protein
LASATITFFPDNTGPELGAAAGEAAGSAASLPPLAQRKAENTVKTSKQQNIFFINNLLLFLVT